MHPPCSTDTSPKSTQGSFLKDAMSCNDLQLQDHRPRALSRCASTRRPERLRRLIAFANLSPAAAAVLTRLPASPSHNRTNSLPLQEDKAPVCSDNTQVPLSSRPGKAERRLPKVRAASTVFGLQKSFSLPPPVQAPRATHQAPRALTRPFSCLQLSDLVEEELSPPRWLPGSDCSGSISMQRSLPAANATLTMAYTGSRPAPGAAAPPPAAPECSGRAWQSHMHAGDSTSCCSELSKLKGLSSPALEAAEEPDRKSVGPRLHIVTATMPLATQPLQADGAVRGSYGESLPGPAELVRMLLVNSCGGQGIQRQLSTASERKVQLLLLPSSPRVSSCQLADAVQLLGHGPGSTVVNLPLDANPASRRSSLHRLAGGSNVVQPVTTGASSRNLATPWLAAKDADARKPHTFIRCSMPRSSRASGSQCMEAARASSLLQAMGAFREVAAEAPMAAVKGDKGTAAGRDGTAAVSCSILSLVRQLMRGT